MAKLPFERSSRVLQTNRLAAPAVPNAPKPLNVLNSVGMTARYQALRSFGDALGSIGELMAIRINQENKEEKRLQFLDINNMVEQSGQSLISALRANPPTTIQGAELMVMDSLYGENTGTPEKPVRKGGLFYDIKEKYGNSKEIQILLEQVAIDQRFRAKAVGIQQEQNLERETLKNNYFSAARDFSALPLEPDVLTKFKTRDEYSDHVAKQLEELEKNVLTDATPAISQQVSESIMAHLFSTHDQQMAKYDAMKKDASMAQFDASVQELLRDSTKTNQQKLKEYTQKVDQEVLKGNRTKEQGQELVYKFERNLDTNLAAQMLEVNPQELLRVMTYEGVDYPSKETKKRTEEGFEFRTFDNADVAKYRAAAGKQVEKIRRAEITAGMNRLDLLIDGVIAGANEDQTTIEADFQRTATELAEKFPDLEPQIDKKYAALDYAVLLTEESKNILTYSKEDLEQAKATHKPDFYLYGGNVAVNPYYAEQMRIYKAFEKQVSAITQKRKTDGRFFYEANIPEYNQETLYGGAFSANEIAKGLRHQMEWDGSPELLIKQVTDIDSLNPLALNRLLKEHKYQFWSKATHEKLVNHLGAMQSGLEMSNFLENLDEQAGPFAPYVFAKLKQAPEDLGIDFTHGDFLITEVHNNEFKEMLFAGKSNSAVNRKSLNSIFNLPEGQTMTVNQIERELLNNEFFYGFYSSLGINEFNRAGKQEEMLNTVTDYVLENARVYGIASEDDNLEGKIGEIVDTSVKQLIEDNFLTIEASGSAFFSKDHTIAINKKYIDEDLDASHVQPAVKGFIENVLDQTIANTERPELQQYLKNVKVGEYRLGASPDGDGLILYIEDPKTSLYQPVTRTNPTMTQEQVFKAKPLLLDWDQINNLARQEKIVDDETDFMSEYVYPFSRALKDYIETNRSVGEPVPRTKTPIQQRDVESSQEERTEFISEQMNLGNFVDTDKIHTERRKAQQIDEKAAQVIRRNLGIVEEIDAQLLGDFVPSAASDNPNDYPFTPIVEEEVTKFNKPIRIDEAGNQISEVSTTIEVTDPNGNTSWVNSPSIDKDGKPHSDEEVKNIIEKNGTTEDLQGDKLKKYDNKEDAIQAAEERSKEIEADLVERKENKQPKINIQKRSQELYNNYDAMIGIVDEMKDMIESEMIKYDPQIHAGELDFLQNRLQRINDDLQVMARHKAVLDITMDDNRTTVFRTEAGETYEQQSIDESSKIKSILFIENAFANYAQNLAIQRKKLSEFKSNPAAYKRKPEKEPDHMKLLEAISP